MCGVTRLADAERCADEGVDAIGLNFWPRSPRRCEPEVAAEIARAIGERVRVVGVVVDASVDEVARVRALGVSWIQLHGAERPGALQALLPCALKALHVVDRASLAEAMVWPGDELLVDARTEALPGGTGVRCDWDLAAELARARSVWLAGGLAPDNVADAIARVAPMGVDVASGVESAPGVKDHGRVRAFVAAAREVPPPRVAG